MKISIIHPSRNRPELAMRTAMKWWVNSLGANIEYLLSVDEDDSMLPKYAAITEHNPHMVLVVGKNNTAIEAINNAALVSTGDLLIVVSDDFDCPARWDVDLLEYLKGKKDFVVKTWDGLQPWIMTLPIMDRVYYERFGYIYYPGYKHMFCDTEMTHVGDLLDRTVIVPMTFPHKHYSQAGGIKKDNVSEKNDSTWTQGEKLYLERLSRNFDLPKSEVKGVLRCDEGHLRWLASKGFLCERV